MSQQDLPTADSDEQLDAQQPDVDEPDIDDDLDVEELDGDTAGVPSTDLGLADPGSLAATEEPDAEDAMLDSWADDADALGTEAGGFGPDRPRDARMPGVYTMDEIDDVAAPGDVHDDDLTGQGEPD